jgi:hypothetical protein
LPIRNLQDCEKGKDMKINPEISSVINLVRKDADYHKKTEEKAEDQRKVADIVSVENNAASRSHVENVEQARALLSDVMNGMEDSSPSLHNLDQYRITQLIS